MAIDLSGIDDSSSGSGVDLSGLDGIDLSGIETSPVLTKADEASWLTTDDGESSKSFGRAVVSEGIAVAKVAASLPSYAVGLGGRVTAAVDMLTGAPGDPIAEASKRWEDISREHPYLTDPVGTILKDLQDTGDISEGVGEGSVIEKGLSAISKGLDSTKVAVTDLTGSEAAGSAVSLAQEVLLLGTHKVVGKGAKATLEKAKEIKDSIVKPKETPVLSEEQKVKAEEYAKSKMKDDEQVTEAMARRREDIKQAFIESTPEDLHTMAVKSALTAAEEAKSQVWKDVLDGRDMKSLSKEQKVAAAKKAEEVYDETYSTEKQYGLQQLTSRQENLKRSRGIVDTPPNPNTSTMEELPVVVEVPKHTGPLAHTDKNGNITINTEAAIADFHSNFKYIFDADTPSGLQKKIVFDKLGIDSPETFRKVVPTPEAYEAFLRAHEESHVLNKDADVYPRKSDGKPDLSHPNAIDIEVRATRDALETASKFSNESIQTPSIRSAMTVVSDSLNDIRTKIWHADTFKNTLLKEVPEDLRHEMTRNLDSGKDLKSDLEHKRDIQLLKDAVEKNQTVVDVVTNYSKDSLKDTLDQILAENGGRRTAEWYDVNRIYEKYDHYKEIVPALQDRIASGKSVIENKSKRSSADSLLGRPSSDKPVPSDSPMQNRVKVRLDDIGNRAKEMGLIDGLLDNYITHVLDFSKTKMSAKEQANFLKDFFATKKDSKLHNDFTKNRQYETLKDLEKAVEGTGVIVHTDIAKVVEAYEKSMETAIIHHNLIKHFEESLATDGRPYLVKYNVPVPDQVGYVKFTGLGSKPLEEYVVHPELAKELGFLFRESDPGALLQKAAAITNLIKSINVQGSTFHAYNLGIAGITAAPITIAKALTKTGIAAGKAMVEASPNLLKGPTAFTEAMSQSFARTVLEERSGINQALKNFREGTDLEFNTIMDTLIKDGGLIVEYPELDVSKTVIADAGKWVDSNINKLMPKSTVKLVQHATEPLDRLVLQRLNHFTWDYMHTGLKVHTAMTKFSEMKRRNPEMSDKEIARSVATHVNDSFGGLNWAQIAADTQGGFSTWLAKNTLSKKGLDMAQILFFAPDWTMSTARAMTKSLPEELLKPQNWKLREGINGTYNPKTAGDLSRRYVLATVIGYLTIQNAVNIAQSGHPIYENKDVTRIDNGDGTTTQLAKHSMEGAEWITHFWKTGFNKLAFLPHAGMKMADYQSDTTLERAKDVAESALPFSVGSALNAPKGQGTSRFVGSVLGVPTYGKQDRAHMDLDLLAEQDAENAAKGKARTEASAALRQEYDDYTWKKMDKARRKELIKAKIEEIRQ